MYWITLLELMYLVTSHRCLYQHAISWLACCYLTSHSDSKTTPASSLHIIKLLTWPFSWGHVDQLHCAAWCDLCQEWQRLKVLSASEGFPFLSCHWLDMSFARNLLRLWNAATNCCRLFQHPCASTSKDSFHVKMSLLNTLFITVSFRLHPPTAEGNH